MPFHFLRATGSILATAQCPRTFSSLLDRCKVIYDDYYTELSYYTYITLRGRIIPNCILCVARVSDCQSVQIEPRGTIKVCLFISKMVWHDEDNWGGNPLVRRSCRPRDRLRVRKRLK